MSDSPYQFPPTHWSLIAQARTGSAQGADEALNSLCRVYWPPLYAFARRKGATPEAAQDLVQEFLARFIENGDLIRSAPERGRFRSFLLTSFQNHLTSSLRQELAEKRGGRMTFIAWEDAQREERWHKRLTTADEGPERVFDRRWAEETMRRAMGRLEDDYRRGGSELFFAAIKPALVDEKVEDLATLGRRFGLTAGSVGSAVHRMRAKYREALRFVVSQTVVQSDEVDEEVRYLLTLLAR